MPSSAAELLHNINPEFMSNSCLHTSTPASLRWRLRPRDLDFTVFAINDLTTRDTHLVDEDGQPQVIRHRVFSSNGFSKAFRRTAHLIQPFLGSSDISKLRQIFPAWHPYYNDMPLCTPLPCIYRRLHGFGRDHIQVSTAYTEVAPYFLFHMAWPFLDPAS